MSHPIVVLATDAPLAYREFWRLWNDAKYFECHEALEELWRAEQGRRRLLFHGLIHGAIARYQQQRGNAWGAVRQLRRAQIKLESLCPKYFESALGEVDLDGFLLEVESAVASSSKVLSSTQCAQLNELEIVIRCKLAREYPELRFESEA